MIIKEMKLLIKVEHKKTKNKKKEYWQYPILNQIQTLLIKITQIILVPRIQQSSFKLIKIYKVNIIYYNFMLSFYLLL